MKLSLLKRKILNRGAYYISLWKLRPLLANLNEQSLVLDCGANIGEISQQFLNTGAEVIAFEPDPTAFALLEKRFRGKQGITLMNKAVWTEDTQLTFYLHEDRNEDHAELTVSSSVYGNKKNVSQEHKLEVEAIDLIDFIDKLDRRVSLIKIDIEGAETDILFKMIEAETYKKFDLAVVETHESKIPGQAKEIEKINALFEEKGIDNIKLNWI